MPRRRATETDLEAGGLFDVVLRSRGHAVFNSQGGGGGGGVRHWGTSWVWWMNAMNRFLLSNLGVEEKEGKLPASRF